MTTFQPSDFMTILVEVCRFERVLIYLSNICYGIGTRIYKGLPVYVNTKCLNIIFMYRQNRTFRNCIFICTILRSIPITQKSYAYVEKDWFWTKTKLLHFTMKI